MTEDEIFFPGDLRKLRKTTPITINEKTYPNLKEAEDEEQDVLEPSDWFLSNWNGTSVD